MKMRSYLFNFRVFGTIVTIVQKAALLGLVIALVSSCAPEWQINNPYEEVDWQNDGHYKANLHTHTTVSDGMLNPHMVVDNYHELGYDILAVTDHNAVTYPWTGFSKMEASQPSKMKRTIALLENYFAEKYLENPAYQPMVKGPMSITYSLEFEDRDPADLGMIDIQGNELSRHHHMGSFFSDHNGTTSEIESLDATLDKDGITMLYHPGRYYGRSTDKYNLQWYVDLYNSYDHLIGLEVYNSGNRYPDDRKIWDSILTVTMPERPLWGYSNDDMHMFPHLGRNWNNFILSELTHESVRHGMENGLSYFVYSPQGHNGPSPPVIKSIIVNNRRGTIEIIAEEVSSVQWISEGNVVSTGTTVNLNELKETGNYIRAMLYGTGETVAGTQPFGIVKP